MMKKNIIYILSISLIFIASCSDDEDKGFIEAVTNLKAQPGENSITLSWDHPENETLSYIDIEYSYSTENNSIRYETTGGASGETSIPVSDKNKEDVFYFTLTAWNTSGKQSYPATIKSKIISMDMESRMHNLLESVEMEPITRGAKVRWSNAENAPCQIKVSYRNNGETAISYFDAQSTHCEGVIEELNPIEITFTVEVINQQEGVNGSGQKEFTFTPFNIHKLSKENWSIVGYSSQRAESGNGSAACLIDGTNKTSWWAGNIGAPEWVIVDLGAVATIEKLSLQRTTEVTTNTAWDVMFSIDMIPNPAAWMYEWEYYTTQEDADLRIEFNRNYEGEQIYPPKVVVQGRYIKITGTRIGGGHTVHFGEFSIYGSYLD